MNFEQTEKLKKLIQASPILNITERQEWLALLDLMNDKQLLELQRILESALPPFASLPRTVMPVLAPLTPKEAVKPKPESHIPEKPKAAPGLSLGHILNLPKINLHQDTKVSPPALPARPDSIDQRGIKPPLQKDKTGFWTTLKNIFKEQELPEPKEILELPSGYAKTVLKPEKPVVSQPIRLSFQKIPPQPPKPIKPVIPPLASVQQAAKPVWTEKPAPGLADTNFAKDTINIQPPSAFKPQSFPPLASSRISSGGDKISETGLSRVSIPSSVLASAPPQNQPEKTQVLILGSDQSAPSTPEKTSIFVNSPTIEIIGSREITIKKPSGVVSETEGVEEEKQLKEGIKADLAKFSSKIISLIKPAKGPKVQVPLAFNPLSLKPKKSLAVSLNSNADVANLNLSAYANNDPEAIVLRLIELKKRIGLHDLILSLENSPVFKAYLETGQKILTDESSFEELEQKQGAKVPESGILAGKYLTREQFERFTDLLRQVQAG